MSTCLYKHTRENRLEDIDMERNWKVALPRMTEKLNSKVYSEGEEETFTEDGWKSFKYVLSEQNATSSLFRHKKKLTLIWSFASVVGQC